MNTPTLEQARILIVDDDSTSLAAFRNVLRKLGFNEILLLQDSTQVVVKLAEFQPDLVITDLDMPELNGIRVTELVQEMTPPGEIVPVLVVTGHGSLISKRAALAAGATDFLAKPCDASELHVRVRNLLRIRALQKATQAYSQELERTVAARTSALENALAELKQSHLMTLHEERLRAFAEMAGGVVHDFNNSLMTIIGYSDLLLAEPNLLDDREETRATLKIINTAGNDAAHVVDRLREFYNVHDAPEQYGPVNFNEVIKDVVQFTQPKWRGMALADGRKIKFDFDLNPVPTIHGNVAELREVVTNLVFNAVDAMPDGGTITCSTRCHHARVIVEIVDTGAGMPPEVRARCLEAFFTTKGEKGTGLGLSMVAGIVRRHSGTMDIQSEPNTGTMVRIELPVGPIQQEPVPEAVTPNSKPLRILVVDDDPLMRDIVTRLLAHEGHTVVHANSGIDALEHAEREQFDLMVTDHAMPDMNGVELATVMRQFDPKQRVILFTGYPIEADATPAEISCVLKKPAQPRELKAAITKVMAA